jgi:hypothetical protein
MTRRGRSRFAGGRNGPPTTAPKKKMKNTMTLNEITDALRADGNAGWSNAGARALAEYLVQLEDETGEEFEFDRVAFRCDWTEYESALEAAGDYFRPGEGDNVTEAEALAYLRDRTAVITFDGGIIIGNY